MKTAPRKTPCFYLIAAAAITLVISTTPAPATVLYDASLSSNPLLNDQGWLFQSIPAITVPSVTNNTLTLDTDAQIGTYAGYSRIGPTLNADDGYQLTFDLKIVSELHDVNTNRAGFSIIAVSSDTSKAIEIGFWTNEIFAQDDTPLFTKDESVAFTTNNAFNHYALSVNSTGYQLFANGDPTPILSGNLRDYTAFDVSTSPTNPFDPYETPNFIFFGDDTSSAKAIAQIKRIEHLIPEPSSALFCLIGITLLAQTRPRRN